MRDRRDGRETFYRAKSEGLAPMFDWIGLYAAFWEDRFQPVGRFAEEDGSMTKSTDTSTLVVEREMPHAPEKVWRALTQPALIADSG